jgi:choline dehydrogenase-like flavoprotein
MGGSTVGYALAQHGHRVLFIEKGMYLFGDHDRGDGTEPGHATDPVERLRQGAWPLPLEGSTDKGEMKFFAPLGCGTGGSTSLYAGQLERMTPADFAPRAQYRDITGSTLPEAWPISYEELLPYYRRAETLFHVCGTPDPLHPDPESALLDPPPLSPRDEDLYESFRELGLHPYRAHMAVRFQDDCMECAGALCPHRCRGDAGSICMLPAVEKHGAALLPECEVLRLEADATRVTNVHCRRQGEEFAVRARVVVLAAGAYMTPILLLKSQSSHWPDGLANRSGLVGRNLMLHTSDFIAVRLRRQLPSDGPRKSLSLNDFYIYEGTKLGTVQSGPVRINYGYVLHFLRTVFDRNPRKWLRPLRPLLRIVAVIGAFHYRNAAVYANIVEDLPYHDNRVLPDPSSPNGMRFEYTCPDELLERNRLFRSAFQERLSSHHSVVFLTGENNLNYGHPSGTCRFGDETATSVLDRNNRAHDVENLYVVDASFFPSSGGINPSLTIAANALRVAEVIHSTSLRG